MEKFTQAQDLWKKLWEKKTQVEKIMFSSGDWKKK